MLTLNRRVGEEIVITVGGERVIVKLVLTDRNQARIGFVADRSVTINRREVQERIDAVSQEKSA